MVKKTLRIAVDEELLQKVELTTQIKKVSRSQFICKAIEEALHRLEIEEKEKEQIEGYSNKPVTPGEFDVWESEQSWGNQ